MLKFFIVQICSLILVGFITCLANKKRILPTKSLKTYRLALYFVLISLSFDILSVFCILQASILPIGVINFVCKTYLISLIGIAFFALNYLMTNLVFAYKLKWLKITIITTLLVLITSIIFHPIYIHYDGESLYSLGPAVNIAYYGTLSFIILSLIFTFIFSKRINRQRILSIRLWLAVWVIAALIQYFNNEILLVGFATALGITLVFGEIENPIVYLDTDTNFYNLKAIKTYANGIFSNGNSVYGFCFMLNTFTKTLTPRESYEIIAHIADYFNKTSAKVFRIDSYSFILMCDKKEVDYYFRQAKKMFSEMNEKVMAFNGIGIHYGVINEDDVFDNLEDVTNVYYYLKTVKNEEVVYIDKILLNELKQKELIKLEIKNALIEDRVEVFFQPIYDTRKKSFTSAEALVRIKDNEGKIIPPASFIDIAEDSGLIVPLGQRIFEKVCELLSNNNLKKFGIDYIEVNLSVLQFKQPDLFETFKGIMELYNVKPNQINFELTESAQLFKNEKIDIILNKFLKLGSHFSLDDFGTGNSNLDYIANMPVSIIKFDYKMTQDYFTNSKTKTVIEYVIPMIQKMNFEIVCEGIEEKYQLDTMCDLGVEHIQGYYFSKPLPTEKFVEFLKEKNTN